MINDILAFIMGVVITFIVMIVVFLAIVGVAARNTERLECQVWKFQQEQYEGFFMAPWQIEQCEEYGLMFES